MSLKFPQPIKLGELASKIGAELAGNALEHATREITGIGTLDEATVGNISFLSNPLYKKNLLTSKASAVVLSRADAQFSTLPTLLTDNPRLALAKLLNLCVAVTAISADNKIHPTAVIGNNVKLGKNIIISAYCVIGDDCELADNIVLHPHVVLYSKVRLGKNCTVHSGTVLGADGFGYAMDATGAWIKMPHLGGVKVGENVEIGSNTCIDRGMIGDTVIGNNVILDNQLQIAHNVEIGDYTAIAGCVGIAGSTKIGKRCLIGGASNIAGHIVIADRVHITATSAVSNSIDAPGVYSSGLPARENKVWRRSVARFMGIDDMAKRIREIEKQLQNAEKVNDTIDGINK